jgi:hypothetical protein
LIPLLIQAVNNSGNKVIISMRNIIDFQCTKKSIK